MGLLSGMCRRHVMLNGYLIDILHLQDYSDFGDLNLGGV